MNGAKSGKYCLLQKNVRLAQSAKKPHKLNINPLSILEALSSRSAMSWTFWESPSPVLFHSKPTWITYQQKQGDVSVSSGK
jgi:hypothetical protein